MNPLQPGLGPPQLPLAESFGANFTVRDPSRQNRMASMPADRMAQFFPSYNGLRLSAWSTLPLAEMDFTPATSVYLHPMWDDRIALLDPTSSRFVMKRVSSVPSVSLSGIAAGSLYDVYAYVNKSGTVALELSSAWTNAYTRAQDFTSVHGVYVKAADPTRRLIGTVAGITGGGATCDTSRNRLVANLCNTLSRSFAAFSGTSFTSAGGGFAEYASGGTNLLRCSFVQCSRFNSVMFTACTNAYHTSAFSTAVYAVLDEYAGTLQEYGSQIRFDAAAGAFVTAASTLSVPVYSGRRSPTMYHSTTASATFFNGWLHGTTES